jgi:hypothetical protein
MNAATASQMIKNAKGKTIAYLPAYEYLEGGTLMEEERNGYLLVKTTLGYYDIKISDLKDEAVNGKFHFAA